MPRPHKITPHPHRRRPSHDEIRRHARHYYERSGCVPGRDLDNWLEAEAWLLEPEAAPVHFRPHVKPGPPLPDPCAIPSEAHLLGS